MPAEEGLGFALNPGGDAQAAETDRDMAGNVQDRKVPDPHGEFVLPGGAEAFQNIPYEGIPETVDQPPPPEVVAKPTIPGPQYAPQGSSGGIPLFLTTTTEESQPALVPQQPPGQPPTGDAATPFQPLAAAADAVEAAPSSDPPLDPPFDPNPPTIDASDLGEALTFDGGLSDGNFVGDQGAGDTNASPVVASVDFAANFTITAPGPGATRTTVYALGLDGAYTEGSPSGLTSGGVPIRLYEIGGVITGSTSLTEGGVNAGNTTFTIEIGSSSGVLTLTQSQPIDHSQTDIYDGAYIEDLALLANGQVELLVSVTDDYGSGIVRSATASIDLGGNVKFGDDGPGNPSVTVSGTEPVLLTFDGGLTEGNFVGAEGSGDTNASALIASVDYSGAFTTGNLSDYGADGAGTGSSVSYELSLDSAYPEGSASGLESGGVAIRLYEEGGVITGSTSTTEGGITAGNTAFTIEVNSTSGVVTLTQSMAIDHSQPDTYDGAYIEDLAVLANDLVELRASVSATSDSEGDVSSVASATLDLGGNVKFGDDGPGNPSVTVSGTEPVLLTFDGGLTEGNFVGAEGSGDTNASALIASVDYSGAFTTGNLSDYGADGAGTGSSVSYELSLDSAYPEGSASGLESGGVAIRLYEEGGVITGSTSTTEGGITAGNTAFTIEVNSTSGVVTLTQSMAIDHSQPDTYDGAYIEDLAVLANDLVELRASVSATSDSEGDVSSVASATLDLGGNVKFGDDGPGNPSVTVSGTEPVLLTFDGGLTEGNFVGAEGSGDTNASALIASVDYSGAFTTGNLSDYGADGAGTGSSVSYELSLDSAYPEGSASGLESGGVAIRLYEEGGVITGSTSTTEGGITAGNTAFTIEVNSTSGVVTLTQSMAIDHSQPDTYDGAYIEDLAVLANDLVELRASVSATSDSEGDVSSVASATLDLGGNVKFGDDGPGNPSVTVSGTEPVLLTFDGGLTEGNFVGAEGSGDTNASALIASVDYSGAFTTGNLSDYGADGAGTGSSVSYELSLDSAYPEGSASGLESGGVAIRLYEEGGVITGSTSTTEGGITAGNTAFTIEVNSTSGVVTLTQSMAIDHSQPDTYDGAYIEDLAVLANDLVELRASVSATSDSEGDVSSVASATLDLGGNVKFGDDGPGNPSVTVSGTEPVLLTFDGGLTEGNFVGAEGSGDTNASALIASVDYSGAFTTGNLSDYGADGAGTGSSVSYELSLDSAYPEGSASGLESGGVAIRLYEEGGVITGSTSTTEGGITAGNTAFTIEVNSTSGVVTLTQSMAIDHSQPDTYDGAYIEDLAVLANDLVELRASVSATSDSEGDVSSVASATLDLGGNVKFGDDGPGNPSVTVSGTEPVLLTFDGGLTEGNFVGAEGSGDTNASALIASVDYSGAFTTGNLSDYGADGAGTGSSVSYELSLDSAYPEGSASGLESGGVAIRLYEEGGVITGSTSTTEGGITAGNTAFTIEVNSTSGVVTLTQSMAIDHSQPDTYDGAYIEDLAVLANDLVELRASVSATSDSEGDVSSVASATLDLGGNVKFGDDGPLPNPVSTVTLTAPYNSSSTPVLWANQFYDWSYGADLVSPLLSAASIDVSLTSGTSTDFSIANIVYGADYDFSFDVFYDNGIAPSLVSSVYLDADGTDLLFVYSLPTEKVLVDVDSLTPAAGGPQPAYEYIDINSAGLDLVVTGSGDVNNSSNGWAVGGNQNINPGESIVFSYFSDYGLVGPPTPEFVTDFEFQTSKYTGGISSTRLAVEVFYSDGSVGFWIVSGLLEGATIAIGDTGLVAVNPDPGDPPPVIVTGAGHTVTDYSLLYREVDIQYIGQKGGLNLTNAAFNSYEQNADGLSFAVNIVPIDSDGDTATETLTVVLEGTDGTSDELDVSVGPVVLDLNRDSTVEYLHLESSAEPYSLGIFQLAAWLAPADGLLVYDYNADGLIAEPKEFVFTMWGDDPAVLSDMQALAAYFDSTGDGFLDASDDAWEYFGVWQDLNIDGIQQEGEFYGLDHWGIESIALEYDADSASYAAADGDVQVYGQMTVTYDDGTTGLAEDVAFAVASVDRAEILVEPIAVDSSAVSSVEDLVSSYLESMHSAGDLDGNGDLSQSEFASGLDLAVNDYLTANALSADEYGAIEQEVFNLLSEQINDLDPDSPVDIQIDDQGNADAADLIAALDLTFDELMPPDVAEAFDPVPVASEYG